MTTSLGRLVARLGDPSEIIPDDLVSQINENIKPLKKLTENDVEIRTMFIVSDAVNSFGGKFPLDEHALLAQRLIDSPVLVGHRKDHLPIARTFFAEAVEYEGRPWVKSYFYWLKSDEKSDQLRENIDGGIYKECSIAFTFSLPECSICGRDIRNCSHEPFVEYQQQGERIPCHFNYRQIDKVLESSLVYRGAIPGTSMGKVESADQKLNLPELLEPDRKYLVTPRYEGLDIFLSFDRSGYRLLSTDGLTFEIPYKECANISDEQNNTSLTGRLVGYRGRERCNQKQLIKYLKREPSRVSRLVFHLFPGQTICKRESSPNATELEIRGIPYRLTSRVDLRKKSREITTRFGVEVRELNPSEAVTSCNQIKSLLYQPASMSSNNKNNYRLTISSKDESGSLEIEHDGRNYSFTLNAISLKGLKDGLSFKASAIIKDELIDSKKELVSCQGGIVNFTNQDGGFCFRCEGGLSGKYHLRPIKHNNQESFLFYQKDRDEHKRYRNSSDAVMVTS